MKPNSVFATRTLVIPSSSMYDTPRLVRLWCTDFIAISGSAWQSGVLPQPAVTFVVMKTDSRGVLVALSTAPIAGSSR